MNRTTKLFQSIYALYALANRVIAKYGEGDPKIAAAGRVLRGLYNQYDAFKEFYASKIETAIIQHWSRYAALIDAAENGRAVTLVDVFAIVTDQLSGNATAMANIHRLKPLTNIPLHPDDVRKIVQILRNIEFILGIAPA